MKQAHRRKGATLLIVLGVLTLLSLLAVTFAHIQIVEQRTAESYVDGVRARLLARAGVEMAYSRLLEGIESGQISSNAQFLKALTYFGKDDAETGNPALTSAPLEEATSPSLAVETAVAGNPFAAVESPQDPLELVNFTPRQVWIDGASGTIPVGVSGILEGGTHGRNSDFYTLAIRDVSGMIHVNDGIGEHTSYGSVSKNLRRILNRLGDATGVPLLGDMVLQNRPAGGYPSKHDLARILGKANFDKVSAFLTTRAWVDTKVPNPVPLSSDAGVRAYYDSWFPGYQVAGPPGPSTIYYRGDTPSFRFGRGVNYLGAPAAKQLKLAGVGPGLVSGNSLEHGIYAMDELFPQWIEMTSRAPVNLNMAPREVLVALLADVHGFWVAERRRNNPPSRGGNLATWSRVIHSYDDMAGVAPNPLDEGDEFGFLVTSDPIKPFGQSGPNSAEWIAAEIIACRNRAVSPNFAFNYQTAPFGGPFRSWRQFNLFCDNLVEIGAVRDARSGPLAWYDYATTSNWGLGALNSPAYAAELYRRLGSQAIADAIKANFNPNLHLNEANPDENMNLMIDKTDLIVMSTEGTLFPTGFYEIESLGRVVRPQGADALAATLATPCQVVAEFKVTAVVKLYDAIRLTTQRDFYGAGTLTGQSSDKYWDQAQAPCTSIPGSSNGLSIEIGPEPDWGAAAQSCDWGGYIAWPTNGADGDATGMAPPRVPGTPITSPAEAQPPAGSTCFYSVSGSLMHSHFSRGDCLHSGVESEFRNLNRVDKTPEINTTFPDPGETTAGPYDPFRNPDPWSSSQGNRHRLARSFRVPIAGQSVTGSVVPAGRAAPLDLRTDGLYLERHSTLAYWINRASVGTGNKQYQMAFSYWLKPKFRPEVASKMRLYFNWNRRDKRGDLLDMSPVFNSAAGYMFPMAHYFCASQDPTSETANWNTNYWGYVTPIRPASMVFLNWQSFSSYPSSWGPARCYGDTRNICCSPTLNHQLHSTPGFPSCLCPTSTGRGGEYYLWRNPLAAGRWMHFTYYWSGRTSLNSRKMYINGQALPAYDITYGGSGGVYNEYGDDYASIDWTRHTRLDNTIYGDMSTPLSTIQSNMEQMYAPERNLIRIGESDKWDPLDNSHGHNFSPDSTIDEFQLVRGTETQLLQQYRYGRYHIPRGAAEGIYVSPPVPFPTGSVTRRALPAATSDVPSGAVVPAPPGVALTMRTPKVIGVAWSWAAEWVDSTSPGLDPVLTDYATVLAPTFPPTDPAVLKPLVECSLQIDGVWTPVVQDDFFSQMQAPIPATATDFRIRFQFRWKAGGAPGAGSFVHATPYIDDATIYFTDGQASFLEYYAN